jgi:hypothetical protein
VNTTRHRERLAADAGEVVAPPSPKMQREIEPWARAFETGYDFFHELEPLGLLGSPR